MLLGSQWESSPFAVNFSQSNLSRDSKSFVSVSSAASSTVALRVSVVCVIYLIAVSGVRTPRAGTDVRTYSSQMKDVL